MKRCESADCHAEAVGIAVGLETGGAGATCAAIFELERASRARRKLRAGRLCRLVEEERGGQEVKVEAGGRTETDRVKEISVTSPTRAILDPCPAVADASPRA